MTEIWIVLFGLGLSANPVGPGNIEVNRETKKNSWAVFKSSTQAANYIAFIKPSSGTFKVIRGFDQNVKADIKFSDKNGGSGSGAGGGGGLGLP
jgi:hypothetical protein